MEMVCGSGTILLFIILLIIRLGIPGTLFTGTGKTVSLPQKNIPAGEAWMNIIQDGRKIGYAQLRTLCLQVGGTIRTAGGFYGNGR